MSKMISQVLKFITNILIFGYVFVEEIPILLLIDPIINLLRKLNIYNKLSNYLEQETNRYIILLVFITPFLIAHVFSFFALKFFAQGYFYSGCIFYAIKLLLTIPVALIFNLAKKKLTSFIIIRKCYLLIITIKKTQFYKTIKKFKNHLKIKIINLKNALIQWRKQ